MISHERIDLVQDLTNDCSVVASLCSMLAREDRGHVRVSFSTAFVYLQPHSILSSFHRSCIHLIPHKEGLQDHSMENMFLG